MIQRWKLFVPVLLMAPLVLVLGSAPAQAVPSERDKQGIQAGAILTGCDWNDAGNQLLADTEIRQRSDWLRLDLRGAADAAGCMRAKYTELLTALDSHIDVIGLLTGEFHSGGPVDFAAAAGEIACNAAFERINVWQIGNEPDLAGIPAATYAEQLARASTAIHACGAEEKVINGGLTAADPIGYVNGIGTALRDNDWGPRTLSDALDGLGMHPYVDAIAEDATGTGHAEVRGFINTVGAAFPGLPLYVTEWGYRLPEPDTLPDAPDEVTEHGQCVNLIRGFNTLVGSGYVAAATWFTLKDFGDNGRRYGLYDGAVARQARTGYVWGHCNGVQQGSYNTDEEWLEWDTGVPAAMATVSYDVMLAPEAAPFYTYRKQTSNPKLLLTAFTPALPVGKYIWRVNKIVDGRIYPANDEWSFLYSGKPAPAGEPSASAHANGTSVTVSWSDNSHNETGFEINNGTVSQFVGAGVVSYTWTGLNPGSASCFRVRSTNANGSSRWSLVSACATTPTTPVAPSNVTVTVVTGTSVRVDWRDNSSNETGFEVNDGTVSQFAGAGVVSYTWSGIANGASKCFRVRATNAVGASAWTTPSVCATTPTIPAAPTGPTAAVVTGTSIRVNWVDRSANEWGFEISDGTTSQVVGTNTTTYTWTGIPNGTNKCFRVRAYNLAGYSAWTANVCATTPTIPVAPASQTATPVSGSQIRVGWADRSGNEIGFEISNGVTSQVVGTNSTTYTWGGLAQGTYMCFRIRSYSLAGYSAWTPYACATTPTLPAVPGTPSAIAVSSSQIRINWADRSSNETSFEISNGVTIYGLAANTTTFTWSGLAPNTYMCFNVRSRNLAGYSAWTPYACTTTPGPPAVPGNPTATAISTSQIRVTWADRSGNETGFQIFDGVSYFNVGANVTTFYRTGLASRQYMCFAVRSFNANGYSAWTPYGCTTTF